MAQDDTNTSSSAGDPLDVARSIIDRDIARLEESIRALKSRRNELSPISRLPTEILCNIFSLIEDYSLIRRINFSQVSQHWRSSALSAPGLWTNIPLSYPRWAQEMLKRSKMAKLIIRTSFQTSKPKTVETVRACLYEMNRVEEININTTPLILKEIFRDLPKSAPQLRTLCIGSHWPRSYGFVFSIHEDFLYDTERLQRVKLINCSISWNSRLLTGLSRLTLENSLEANSSIIQFFRALERMPALSDLDLKDSIPDNSGDYPLTLSSIFPAFAFLAFRLVKSVFPDFSNFLSVLARKFLSLLVIRRLSLHVFNGTEIHGLEFCLETDAIIPDSDCFPHSLTSARSQLQKVVLTWPSSQGYNHVKALTCAFDAMSLPFLTNLRISPSKLDYIDSQTWVNTFGKLPLLERLYVQNSTHSFFAALVYKTKAAEKSKAAYRNVSFPQLRYIQLEETDFSGTSPGSISVDMLLDYLMERCERNAEVQELRLDNCYSIWSDDVVKEIVVYVIWDGKEQELERWDSPELGTELGQSYNVTSHIIST